MTRIIALTSGSEGVGKTCIAINLAACLAAAGKQVCLLELVANASAASTRLQLPVISTLSDRLNAANEDQDLAVKLPAGFDLVVGGTDHDWLWDLSRSDLKCIVSELESLEEYDFVLIDTATDSSPQHVAFALASPEVWLILTPEPASLSEAYARLKLLYAEGYNGQIKVFVNKSKNHAVGRHTYDKFREIANFYLDMQLPLACMLSEVDESVLARIIPSDASTHVGIMSELSNLVDNMISQEEGGSAQTSEMARFAQQYLKAAGCDHDDERDTVMRPVFTNEQTPGELHQQLSMLSGRIDELIAEIERLRQKGERKSALIPMPAIGNPHCEQKRFKRTDCETIANHSETVTVRGESFAVYHLRKDNGELQRFAFHSCDDDLEEPEPQTRLS